MMTGAEYYDYLETAYRNAGTLSEQKWLQPYLRDRNFDWWDFATQNALTQNYNISYKYGNEKSNPIYQATTTQKKELSKASITNGSPCVPIPTM